MSTRNEREQRLVALKRQAAKGEPIADGVRPPGAPFPRASAEEGYYGLPLLKRPTWTWEVPAYFFVGGAAGAAAVVASAARLTARAGHCEPCHADRDLARDARWIAAVGGALSPALLVSDLGRPERFLYMLRVFKPRSPMSVGVWTLVAFSTAAAASTFADLIHARHDGAVPVRVLTNAAELLAAATGTVMTSYTGVLVGATAIPAWNRNVRLLPLHFSASGLASAVSLLELLGHRHRALNLLAAAAALTETAVGALQESKRDEALTPLKEGKSGTLVRAGGLLSGPLPLLLRLCGARRPAALCALAGSLLTRFGWIEAGKVSADDPTVPLGLKRLPEITTQGETMSKDSKKDKEDPSRKKLQQPPKGPRVDPEDPVEEASYESFPASDPPSFSPGTAGPSEEEER